MFVQNRTSFPVELARGDTGEHLSVAAVTLRAVYRLCGTALVPWQGTRSTLATDPPRAVLKHPLWEGTSVTLAGPVRTQAGSPSVARVDLDVASERRTLLVMGDRRWLRNAGKLVASVPAPFEEMPLSWALSFGGGQDVPPGPDPRTGLPHPGGRLSYPANPVGIGYYRDERSADNQMLPNIEWQGAGVRQWTCRPRPAGLAPCPDLVCLRAPHDAPSSPADALWHLRAALRLLHHAPGEGIFEETAPGTEIRIAGLGSSRISFSVPRSPLRVSTVRGKSIDEVGYRVRSVHVSQEDGAVIIDFAHAFGFAPAAAPSWVRVEAAGARLA